MRDLQTIIADNAKSATEHEQDIARWELWVAPKPTAPLTPTGAAYWARVRDGTVRLR